MEQWVPKLLKSSHLDQMAKFWDGKASDLELIGQAENFVYMFPCRGQSCVLRVTHSSHRTKQALNGELDWVDYLHRNGTKVCRPIPSVNDTLVETVKADKGHFSAVVFEHIDGFHLDSPVPEKTRRALIQDLGRTIGKMHRLTKQYTVPADQERDQWHKKDVIANASKYLTKDDLGVLDLYEQQLRLFYDLPRTPDDFGLIHTDIHTWNFFVQDGEVIVFDFDDCEYNWFIYDIMIPIYYGMMDIPSDMKRRRDVAGRLFTDLMTGYRQENELDTVWFDRLPQFLRFRDLQLYTWTHKIGWNQPGEPFYQFIYDNIANDRPCADVDFKKLYESI